MKELQAERISKDVQTPLRLTTEYPRLMHLAFAAPFHGPGSTLLAWPFVVTLS
jgi:hypothetical protein